MQRALDLPENRPGAGIERQWEDGFEISVVMDSGGVRILANPAGLVNLARHLLTLAQEGVPGGRRIRLAELNGLEDGSIGLIIERSS